MPGTLHQGVLSLFLEDPWLGFDLLGLPRPGSGPLKPTRAEVEMPRLDDAQKMSVALPDLVLVSEAGEAEGGVVVCVEAQGQHNRAKRYAICFYQGGLAYQHQRPTWVVMVCFSSDMSLALERWSTGPPPRPEVLILDTDRVSMLSLEEARKRPTAGVLAAALHGARGDIDAARIAIEACRSLPLEKRLAYHRIVLAALPAKKRAVVEKELPMEEYDPLWEIEKQSSPYVYGVRDGHAQGREEGRQETLVEMIVALLDVRNIRLSSTQRHRIESCRELETLRRWAKRARQVSTAKQLLE